MSLLTTIPIKSNVDVKYTSVGPYISDGISLMLSIAAVATFVYLVYGGILWITSSGDKTKVEEARNRITNSLIGLAIVAVSWAVFLLIDNFFGLNIAA